MSRSCATCQHLKRPEIDRRLAAGEPAAQVARDHGLHASSVHRHRTNCLKLASANVIKKDAARGSAAAALLPSKELLSSAYFELRERIDQIVVQAEQQGSLTVAINGLNSIRHTLDSLARLASADREAGAKPSALEQADGKSAGEIAELLIAEFDREPELKARLAKALVKIADQTATSISTTPAPQIQTVPNHKVPQLPSQQAQQAATQQDPHIPGHQAQQPLAHHHANGPSVQQANAWRGQPIVVPQSSQAQQTTVKPPTTKSVSTARQHQRGRAAVRKRSSAE
jgi:hypothetical protein